jgi:predicted GNAT family acetyltransferase
MDEHERKGPDDLPDETLETLPTGDAPANTVQTGTMLAVNPAADDRVADNREGRRFELVIDGQTAVLTYERKGDALVFVHTEVPPALRGRGIGKALVKAGLEAARREGLRIVALCPFVKAYLQKHPEP